MIFPERSPYIRVLPGTASLDIILKNTHFPDELLAPEANTQCRVEWDEQIPAIVFTFKLPSYDFSEPLIPQELKNAEQGWLAQTAIRVRLLLADTVIADRVTERMFVLSERDSEGIRRMY